MGFLGEQGKYVAVSPQRFMAARASKLGGGADGGASDALVEDELLSDGGDHLAFCVLGDPGESIDVAVIAPNDGYGDVLNGTVIVVR